ncbi:2,3-bisphosphoglycerate-dependent phosphoglycerate mutase [Pedobacter sp. PACM 27299]|uniref:2,3-bisphosphoglycerate-dependent phosphoglycerate mutase n=1 Tax=Pedobacter sp. PACM 27299 TaxID=1727164 RepID=UPI000A8AAF71|nr:2,3-bisphosphoglycerate-dependent phosphoglycerate mutase [Pedobacter sp. PACM 27299]
MKDTLDRVVPFYQKEILPVLKQGKTILIVAHGNSLRALTMYLENLNEQEVSMLNIATGIPHVYDFSVDMHLTGKVYL